MKRLDVMTGFVTASLVVGLVIAALLAGTQLVALLAVYTVGWVLQYSVD